jgi:[ribosomal protein S18]-alanine N-acetyltransferase
MDAEGEGRRESIVREFRADEDSEGAAQILSEAKGATPWSSYELSRIGELSGVGAYVSIEGGGICGIVMGRKVLDEAEVLNLAVRDGNRGKGEGRKLLGRLLQDYEVAGVKRVFLEVRESNTDAIGFYRHQGFVPIRTRKDYYQGPNEAALVMELQLGKSTE